MIHNEDAMQAMRNPLSPVKQVRETYSKFLEKHVTKSQHHIAIGDHDDIKKDLDKEHH